MMAPSETPGTTARNRIWKFTIYQAIMKLIKKNWLVKQTPMLKSVPTKGTN